MVLLLGPPLVMIIAWVNAMKAEMVCIIRLYRMMGDRQGSVMRKKVWYPRAPSILAAS